MRLDTWARMFWKAGRVWAERLEGKSQKPGSQVMQESGTRAC